MSFGSWIASAAEAERNRMFQGSEGDKNRAMQKYGIDQNTLLRNEIMKYEFERAKKSQETLDENYLKMLSNIDQEDIHAKHVEEIKKLRESQRPSIWDAFVGNTGAGGYFKGWDKWFEGADARIFEALGLGISPEDIAGPARYEDFKPNDFEGMTVDDMLRLRQFLIDNPGTVSNAPTKQIQTQLNTLLDTTYGGNR